MAAPRPLLAVCVLLGAAAALPAADTARGVVASFDPDSKQLQLGERPVLGRPPLTFVLAPDALLLHGRRPAAPADLVPGRRVRIEYEMRDGRMVARAVHLLGAAPAPPMPPPETRGDELAGALRRVALTDREIVVVGPGARGADTETTVAVPPGVAVLRGGKAVGLEGLKEGEAVRVRVEKRDGRTVAVQVTAGAGGDRKADVIPKIRLGLRLLDMALEQMEQKRDK
jgi:hypothetical protein